MGEHSTRASHPESRAKGEGESTDKKATMPHHMKVIITSNVILISTVKNYL